jgi:hypothetical protein
MVYSILAILLSLTVQQGSVQSRPEALLNRRVSIELNKATVYDVVVALRAQHTIPISFIQSTRSFNAKEEINIKVSNGTVRDVLEKIKSAAPDYRYGFFEGHFVLYPNEPKYQRVIDSVSIREMERLKATYSYLGALRARWPQFKELMAPAMKGNPKAPLYAELVSIKPRGNNQSAVFTIIYWAKGHQPAFFFDIVG